MEFIKSTSECMSLIALLEDNRPLSFLAENFSGSASNRPVGVALNIAIIVIKMYSRCVPNE
jgi:hypothetical protein